MPVPHLTNGPARTPATPAPGEDGPTPTWAMRATLPVPPLLGVAVAAAPLAARGSVA